MPKKRKREIEPNWDRPGKKRRLPKKKKTKRKQTKQDIMDNIKLKEIENWNPAEAIKQLKKTLRQNKREIKKIYEWNFPIQKELQQKLDSVLGAEYKNKDDFIKKILKEVKDKSKKVIIRKAINDTYSNLNQGEVLAAKSTGRKVRKIWTTYFDERVRDWHSRLEGKRLDFDKRFKVPYPTGVDELVAPKVPPISKQNFINCRCFLEYEVGKKK